MWATYRPPHQAAWLPLFRKASQDRVRRRTSSLPALLRVSSRLADGTVAKEKHLTERISTDARSNRSVQGLATGTAGSFLFSFLV